MNYDEEELEDGIEHEAEHDDLIEYIRDNYDPDIEEEEIYAMIATAHLKKDPNYYQKLEDAGL